jgi:glycosyltransferase involved in cell wall biosynthesis
MRILYIIDTLNRGGKERRHVELLRRISPNKSIEIKLVILSQEIEYREIYHLPIDIQTIAKKEGLDFSIFGKIWDITRQYKPHIIHTWGAEQAVYTVLTAFFSRTELINGMVVDAPASIPRFGKIWRYKMMTFPFSRYIIANSYAGFRAYGLSPKKGKVIYNGYDMARETTDQSAAELKQYYGIGNEKTVGMVANISTLKDYATYIKAAQIVLAQNANVKFFCVGADKGLKRDIETLISNEYRNNIVFTGKLDAVEPMIKLFDVCVLATFTEGISNAIMEYMAAGRPEVATDGGGTNELIIDNQTGYLVPPRDAQAMAQKIDYLLNHPDVAQQMGKAGRQRIEKQFSIDRMADDYYRLYRTITS